MEILIGKVEKTVREAARIFKKRTFEIKYKEGFENIVTSADLEIQQFLCEQLAMLVPESGFICEEENVNDSQGREFVWVIDPIDGTTNYARGISESCISVALMKNNEVVLGIVYNPTKDEMFAATKGGGASLNGVPIAVSQRRFEEGILCTAMCVYEKRYAKMCSDIIYDAYMACNDVRRFGSCALELCYIAKGDCELYFEFKVKPWDFAAAYLILTEAGGVLTGFSGEELKLDTPALLVGANNKDNHEMLMSYVTKHINVSECNYEWQKW